MQKWTVKTSKHMVNRNNGASSPLNIMLTLHWVKVSKADKLISRGRDCHNSAALRWFVVSDFLLCYVKKALALRWRQKADYIPVILFLQKHLQWQKYEKGWSLHWPLRWADLPFWSSTKPQPNVSYMMIDDHKTKYFPADMLIQPVHPGGKKK